jgi:aminopeptidase N
MIRTILGDELFERAIHTFVRENAHKTVETIDLLRAIEKATGYNLSFLFDSYVFRGGHPDYKVTYVWDNESNLAKLTVVQTQGEKELFDLKIPIAFGYVDASIPTFTLRIHEAEQTFYFPLAKKPDFISFDVGNNYLKTVSLEYPIAELKAQLKHDREPVSRIYAAIAIGKKSNLEAVDALSEALNDSFWGVRVEVAKQLGNIKLERSRLALIKGLQDPNAKVRRAVVEALGQIKTPESYDEIASFLQKGDESYYVEASAARSLGGMVSGHLKEKEADAIALLKQILEERSGWNQVVTSGAIGGLSALKSSPAAVDIVLDRTKLGIPQPLRLASIRALGAISVGQTLDKVEEILDRLEAIAQETFFLTQVSVSAALGQMETPKAVSILRSLADRTPDGRVRRVAEEAISKVQKNFGSDKAIKELREELETIKQENQDLKSRVAELEAKAH